MYIILICVLVSFAIIILLIKLYNVYVTPMCNCDESLAGKTVLITGGNSGIGRETALELAKHNARVIIASRNMRLSNSVVEDIKGKTGNQSVFAYKLDLSSLASVREFCEQFYLKEKHLHVLINNASLMAPKGKRLTEDNLEFQFATNHFGPFLLTNLLLPLLVDSAPSRIINVSSLAHSFVRNLDLENLNMENYVKNYFYVYCETKLANILFTRALARKLAPENVTVNALHPGAVYSNLLTSKGIMKQVLEVIFFPIYISTKRGAQTTIHLALFPNLSITGAYFNRSEIEDPSSLAQNDELANKLWEISCRMTNLQKRI